MKLNTFFLTIAHCQNIEIFVKKRRDVSEGSDSKRKKFFVLDSSLYFSSDTKNFNSRKGVQSRDELQTKRSWRDEL